MRSNSNLFGAFAENNQYIYSWGKGIGRDFFERPYMQKIDIFGNQIWHTGDDKKLSFEGYFKNFLSDSGFIYAFGLRTTFKPYGFFVSKIDKSTGAVLYEKQSFVNSDGILDVRSINKDSIRVVYYTYDGNSSDHNQPPVKFVTFHKTTGNSSPEKIFSLSPLAPLYIDSSENAYYYSNDTLYKYNLPTSAFAWKSRADMNLGVVTTLIKDAGKIFLFGDRYCKSINDTTGKVNWGIALNSNFGENLYSYSWIIKSDTIYTSWGHDYSGSVSEYGHFSKINKQTGQIYLNGTITDNGGINYQKTGTFRNGTMCVDSGGDIYMMGFYYYSENNRVIKKISGRDGRLLYETNLVPDVLVKNQYNVVTGYPRYGKVAFIFNDKPHFLYEMVVTNNSETSVRVNYVAVGDTGNIKLKKSFDNNSYQFTSAVLDIQKKGANTYVLKKQGVGAYVEKFSADYNLIWRKALHDYCLFTPQSLAIDSAENICIIGGATGNCAPPNDQNSTTTFFDVNRVVLLDKNGVIKNDLFIGALTAGGTYNLLGSTSGFFLFGSSGYYIRIDPITGQIAPSVYYGVANFTSGIYSKTSNKKMQAVDGKDSVYVFSSRIDFQVNSAFCAALNKGNGKRTTTLLSDFPLGYIMHSVRSVTDSSIVYISGLTGNGTYPTLVKYNLAKRATIWKYSDILNSGEIFKTVQDEFGNIYALSRIRDSIKVLKINERDGSLIWSFHKYESDQSAEWLDLDVSLANNMVVAAVHSTIGGYTKPYYIELNASTGALIKTRTIFGDPNQNAYIHSVESLPGSAILIGGTINAESQNGKNGFLFIDSSLLVVPQCNISANFSCVRDLSAPAKFSFTNLSVPDTGLISFKWQFGNGDSSLVKSPVYVYSSPGTYRVTLSVSVNNKCKATKDTVVIITEAEVCKIIPSFISLADSAMSNRIIFQNATTVMGVAKYSWDFGDGSMPDTSRNTSHVFNNSGNYKVCLQITLDNICIKSACKNIAINSLNGGRLQAFPNPASQNITLLLNAVQNSVYNINIINFSGVSCKQIVFNAQQGSNTIIIPVNDLPQGIYLIEANNGTEKLQVKILKL